MANPDDDRGEALFWYLGLLLENWDRAGINGPEIQRRTGVSKAQVSQIRTGKPGGGVWTLIRLAKLDGRSPGQMLDDALGWWERQGRSYRDRKVAEFARKRTGDQSAPDSAERPSQKPTG
jgi:hypothetical protein